MVAPLVLPPAIAIHPFPFTSTYCSSVMATQTTNRKEDNVNFEHNCHRHDLNEKEIWEIFSAFPHFLEHLLPVFQ